MREVNIMEQVIRCCDELVINEEGNVVNAIYELWFEADKYFGTSISNEPAWINFYTDWHIDGSITAKYEIDYPNRNECHEWELTEEEKVFFSLMMSDYCQAKYGCNLSQLIENIGQ